MRRSAQLRRVARRIALSALVAAWLVACGGDGGGGADDAVGGPDAAGDTAPADVPGEDTGADVAPLPDGGGLDVPPLPDVPPPDDAAEDVPDEDVPEPPDVPTDASAGAPCEPNPCGEPNRGVCDESPEPPGYVCSCDLGYVEGEDGACVPDTDVCEAAGDCDDGRFCNGPEDCAPGAPEAAPNGCVAGVAPVDDGDACTTDTCDEDSDQVAHEPQPCPSNGHCEEDDAGAPQCVCDPGYELNEAGLCRACEVDPGEPNDTAAQATSILAARGLRLTSDPTNPDWYTVPVCAGGTLTVEAYFDDREANIDGFLVDADGETVLAADDEPTGEVHLAWSADRDGQVLLQIVMPEGACTRYSLSYLLENCAPCEDDALEPNGDRATAAPIENATEAPLVLVSGNTDFYRLFACANQILRFHAVYDRDVADLRLRILSEDSDVALATGAIAEDGAALEWTAAGQGTWYLAVDTIAVDVCVDYQLDFEKGSCEAPCEADAFEENDTPETATTLMDVATDPGPDGAAVELGALPGDEDWYTVDLCAGEHLVLTGRSRTDEPEAALRVTVFAADGVTVLGEGTTPGTAPWVDVTAVTDETLLVRVTTDRAACDPYRLLVQRSGCQACADDEGEDDDTLETARVNEAAVASSGTACGLDDDWFAVELCEGTGIVVRTLNGDGVIETTLFDRDGTTVLGSATGIMGTEIPYEGIVAGTYYLRVRLVSDRGDPGVPYTVVVDESCCPIDDTEPNDSPDEAFLLAPEVGLGYPSVSPGAEDWFAVNVCPESPALGLAVVLTDPAAGTIDGTLLAGDGTTVLDEGTATVDGEAFAYTATEVGVVYLRLTGTAAFCVGYQLTTGDGLPACGGGK